MNLKQIITVTTAIGAAAFTAHAMPGGDTTATENAQAAAICDEMPDSVFEGHYYFSYADNDDIAGVMDLTLLDSGEINLWYRIFSREMQGDGATGTLIARPVIFREVGEGKPWVSDMGEQLTYDAETDTFVMGGEPDWGELRWER